MKKLFTVIIALMLCCLPSYAQIWEGDGGSMIEEGLGFGGGGGTIDWSEFTGDKCTITFQNYDGTGVQSVVVPVGVPSYYVMSEINEPTKDGYIFEGWSLISDYPTPVTIPDNFVATTTYYSIFTKTKYTVYYNNPDSSLYTSQIYEYGDEITEPTEPTYQNDDFWDWSGLPYEMPAATFTVTAQVFSKTATVYGLEVDLDAVSSATAYTYIYDAADMERISIADDGTVSNFNDTATSWKSFIYEYIRPCMLKLDGTVDYYLDRDNQSLRADGVTASDISDATYQGNAMVEFKKLWDNSRNIKGTRKYKIIISPTEINGITYAEAFKRADGTYVDKVYYSMFQASYDGTSRALSLGLASSRDITTAISVLRQRAQANGSGWDVTYEALSQLIQKLAFMVGKTVEPEGILFQKKHVNKINSGRPANCNAYGIENGCFYVQGNSNDQGLIKTFWINDFYGSNFFVQAGLAYSGPKVMYKNPPFPINDLDGYIEISDRSNDSVYMNYYSENIYFSRLGFYHGIAYCEKFVSSQPANTVLKNNAPLMFQMAKSYRTGDYITPSYLVAPTRADRVYTDPVSTWYLSPRHPLPNLANSDICCYRLTYVQPSAASLSMLSSPKSRDTQEYMYEEPVKQTATPSSDIGGEEKK